MNHAATALRHPIVSADCYSAGERKWMTLTQTWRGRSLAPLLERLTRAGVAPDHVTLLSLLCGLVGAGLWVLSPVAALASLALHVLLDGLDGPLARFQQIESPRGSFTDTMADQAVVTAFSVAVMVGGELSGPAGGVYIFLYAVVALFAIARNALNRPYAWLMRPRFVFFAWFAAELWLWPGTLNALVWCCNVLLALSALTGFVAIRNGLGKRIVAGQQTP